MNLDWVKRRREEIAQALFDCSWNDIVDNEAAITCVTQLLATESLIESNKKVGDSIMNAIAVGNAIRSPI